MKTEALVLVGNRPLPALIANAGPAASRSFLEYFFAHIRNGNTRASYAYAILRFCQWADNLGLTLGKLTPLLISGYVDELGTKYSAPTVKQHLAAIRMCLDWFVGVGVITTNPAGSVRGPKHVVTRGATPVLPAEDARRLLNSIETATLIGLRDRALIGVMLFAFSRVSAAVGMRVRDFHQAGEKRWLTLHEKGGKLHQVPAHPELVGCLTAYIDRAGIGTERDDALFRTVIGRTGRLSAARMSRSDALRMTKRRCAAVGLPAEICCHSFRGTGITTYLENGGAIDKAQAIAAHASPKTTKLYDRTKDAVTLEEIERIVI